MPTVIERYVRSGKLKVDARVLAFIGPDSLRGQSAAIAAGQQDKEFNFAQLLYANQAGENSGWLSDDMVRAAAASIPGLDVNQLLAASDSDAVHAQAQTYVKQATADKVSGTPTLLVGPDRRHAQDRDAQLAHGPPVAGGRDQRRAGLKPPSRIRPARAMATRRRAERRSWNPIGRRLRRGGNPTRRTTALISPTRPIETAEHLLERTPELDALGGCAAHGEGHAPRPARGGRRRGGDREDGARAGVLPEHRLGPRARGRLRGAPDGPAARPARRHRERDGRRARVARRARDRVRSTSLRRSSASCAGGPRTSSSSRI